MQSAQNATRVQRAIVSEVLDMMSKLYVIPRCRHSPFLLCLSCFTFPALPFLLCAQFGLTAMTWLAQELLIVHLVNLLLLLESANLLPDLLDLL